MSVIEKYRCHRQVGWSDEAEVHAGPADAEHRVPIAVKLCHGMESGPMRPNGKRDLFLQAVADQKAAVDAGCKQVAPVFESGEEGDTAYYVTQHFPRSIDSLIQGRVTADTPGLQRLTDGMLKALEQLRDKHGRSHGNLKPTNVFVEGKTLTSGTIILSDLALPAQAGNQANDCYEMGATLYQFVRGRMVRNIDWPLVAGAEWENLGPMADAWRRFFNVLMAPNLSQDTNALATARKAYKNMRSKAAAEIDLGGHTMAPTARGASGKKGVSGTAGKAPPSKGLFAGIGAAAAAIAGAVVIWFQPPGTKWADRLKSAAGFAVVLPRLQNPNGGQPGTSPAPEDGTSTPDQSPGSTPLTGQPTPMGPNATATPEIAEATPTPAPVMTPPPPTPVPTPTEAERYIGYLDMLRRFKRKLSDPAALDQPEALNGAINSFKGDVPYQQVANEPTVAAFVKKLPDKLESTGDQPDLPPNLWTKVSSGREGDLQSAIYRHASGTSMQFNRVASNSGGAAFYLSATTMPMSFGVTLMTAPELAGKIRGISSNAPVSWQLTSGFPGMRMAWILTDAANPGYANTGHPNGDSPLNGLSGTDALALARAAGCALPTLAQWNALLASPAGQEWSAGWQSRAKVRGPSWTTFVRGLQSRLQTGGLLPNTKCFGDQTNVEPVGTDQSTNYFFEPVGSRAVHGFAHLIGNVGQYVVDNAQTPTKYYFAGGSAESAPSVFADLKSPPAVPSPFTPYADAGFRLAIGAKGNGSDKNPKFDQLKLDLDAELARVEQIR